MVKETSISIASFDPNYRELLFGNNKETFIQRSINFIQQSHFFKVSDQEAFLITGKNNLNEAAAAMRAMSNAVFAITIGKEGAFLSTKEKNCIVPGIKVEAVDTTGAGDAFVGAVLFQLSHHSPKDIGTLTIDDWKRIVSNANKAGARTCEYMGAMEAFKHLTNTIFNA